jgi:hypothetical protein
VLPSLRAGQWWRNRSAIISLKIGVYTKFVPNTGTHVKVSKNNIVRVIGNKEAEGLVQDIFIMGLLLDENDEILTRIQRLV